MYSRWTGGLIPTLTFSSQRQRNPKSGDQAITENPLLFAPVYRLAIRLGGLPIKVFGIDAGEKKELPEHPAYTLLRRPNPITPRNLMVAGTVLSMFRYGRMGWLKERDNAGNIVALWPIPGAVLRPKRDPKRLISQFEIVVPGEPPEPLDVSEVCYFRLLPNFDDWADGTSPVATLGETSEFGGEAIKAMIDLFVEGFLERLYMDLHGKELSDERKNALADQVKAARRTPRGVPMMEDGATLEPMGTPPSNDIMTTAVESSQKIMLDTFALPPLDDRQQRLYYSEAVQPLADAIEQELERSLMPEFEGAAFPEFQFREILKGTPAERITAHRDAILSAQETPNEARRDENKPPLEGGDDLFVPLNVWPVTSAAASSGNPPAAGSKGGLGGSEGKGVMPNTPQPRAASLRAAHLASWKEHRTHIVASQAEGFTRRIRGLLSQEQKSLNAAIRAHVRTGVGARAKEDINVPPLERLLQSLDPAVDAELIRFLRQFMDQTSEQAFRAAADFVAGAEVGEIPDSLLELLDRRAHAVTSRFGLLRTEKLKDLFSAAIDNGWTAAQLSEAVNKLYGETLKVHLADGIGRTEMGFAYEEAAKAFWRTAGIRQVDFIFGGGPCTTGVCIDAAAGSPYDLGTEIGDVGFSFEGATSPPLHPSCDCLMVPHIP